eukprot:m.210369 g.210369  ORF g.210369 m.210369 type:complete len:608 (+) comp17143_c0_seq2:1737-3560(+)
MAQLLDTVEIYASGNKNHHVLPSLAGIEDEVLLTSVSNVGLWAHKLESNTCIHSHREAGLQTGSQFVATASPAVEEKDGQASFNGYFLNAVADELVITTATEKDAIHVELKDTVERLISHPSLSHPVVISKEWTLSSVIVTNNATLTATLATSAPAPTWLTESPVIDCIAWKQQLLLIGKDGQITPYIQSSDGGLTPDSTIQLQLSPSQQVITVTASSANLYILTTDGLVSRLSTLSPLVTPLRHTVDTTAYQVSTSALAALGNHVVVVVREATGNKVAALLLDGHYGSLLQTSHPLTLANKKDHVTACLAVGSYVCISTATKVMACRMDTATTVTGLAALLGSVSSLTDDSLSKLLEPKKTTSLDKFGPTFNKWFTHRGGRVAPHECAQLVKHLLAEQRYFASDPLKQLLATGVLNPWDYPTLLQDLAIRKPGLIVFALQHLATVLEADLVSALVHLVSDDEDVDMTVPVAVVLAACQHPLQESALVSALRTSLPSLALRLATLMASALELNATQAASNQRQAELDTLVLLATSVVDANLLHLMASSEGREVAARLHTATSVHLAMSSAMDTVGGMVHSLLQASKHPLKREAAPVPFEVVQLPVAL